MSNFAISIELAVIFLYSWRLGARRKIFGGYERWCPAGGRRRYQLPIPVEICKLAAAHALIMKLRGDETDEESIQSMDPSVVLGRMTIGCHCFPRLWAY